MSDKIPNDKSTLEVISTALQKLNDHTLDPNETVYVPMLHTTEQKSIKYLFFGGKKGETKHTVVVRKMTRSHYLKHYAKDSEGNYIGTGKPAVDAGLVFVPSKSTPEEVLEQVRKVAFGKEHENEGYTAASAPLGLGFATAA